MLRKPAVSGMFYPAKPDELSRLVDGFIQTSRGRKEAFGIMVPHAGYVYSGHVAGETYASVSLPRTFVILCPNHTWLGGAASIMSAGKWATPLGSVDIETSIASRILKRSSVLCEDSSAHLQEHSLEVQLPFLQRLVPDFTFVPISVRTHDPADLEEIGDAVADAILAAEQKVLIIASTDMTHQESSESARGKDRLALEQVEALDPVKLLKVVEENDISMCGVAPTSCAMFACRRLGASKGEVVKYADSGDATGEHDLVVGYAGALFV